jgi:hypothetical protein
MRYLIVVAIVLVAVERLSARRLHLDFDPTSP